MKNNIKTIKGVNNMEMVKENCTKKIDTLGRITVPKGLRDRFELSEGTEMEFLTMDNYICIRKVKHENKYERLVRELCDLDITVPEELWDLCEEAAKTENGKEKQL